jgi:hypothetical protein
MHDDDSVLRTEIVLLRLTRARKIGGMTLDCFSDASRRSRLRVGLCRPDEVAASLR